MTDSYGNVEYKNYPKNKLSDAEFEKAISLKINGPEIRFVTWFGLDYIHSGYTVIAKFPGSFLIVVCRFIFALDCRFLKTLNKPFSENLFKVSVVIII